MTWWKMGAIFLFMGLGFFLSGCNQDTKENQEIEKRETTGEIRLELIKKYAGRVPQEWGEKVSGVKTRINTREKIIALTFDACGGPNGSGYDEKLINYLKAEQIPATLFINGRWIDANPDIFRQLAETSLFEIENHGTLHKPLSVSGKDAYGIKGTASMEEAIDEVLFNQEKIEKVTGRKPIFFRSGTAYYDDITVKIVEDLGGKVVNYNILGDAGATFSKEQVKNALLQAKPGAIVLLHMNQPASGTAEGVMMAIPQLKKMGYRFVKLEEWNPLLL
jgi:peptidoglycan/xylan/chitin deacetylase (PgdA/CDA1 family)